MCAWEPFHQFMRSGTEFCHDSAWISPAALYPAARRSVRNRLLWSMTSSLTSRSDWLWAMPDSDLEYFTGAKPLDARCWLIRFRSFCASAARVLLDTDTMSEGAACAGVPVNRPPLRIMRAAVMVAARFEKARRVGEYPSMAGMR